MSPRGTASCNCSCFIAIPWDYPFLGPVEPSLLGSTADTVKSITHRRTLCAAEMQVLYVDTSWVILFGTNVNLCLFYTDGPLRLPRKSGGTGRRPCTRAGRHQEGIYRVVSLDFLNPPSLPLGCLWFDSIQAVRLGNGYDRMEFQIDIVSRTSLSHDNAYYSGLHSLLLSSLALFVSRSINGRISFPGRLARPRCARRTPRQSIRIPWMQAHVNVWSQKGSPALPSSPLPAILLSYRPEPVSFRVGQLQTPKTLAFLSLFLSLCRHPRVSFCTPQSLIQSPSGVHTPRLFLAYLTESNLHSTFPFRPSHASLLPADPPTQ